MIMRRLGLTALALLCASAVLADPPPAAAPPYRPSSGALIPVAIYDANGNLIGGAGTGLPTTPVGINIMPAYVCTVPAYAAGGTISCLPDDGSATYAATCAANAPCPLPPLTNRRRAFFMTLNAGSGVTATFGYGSAIAPGRGTPIDPGGASGGMGGSTEDLPAFTGTYYVTAPSPVTIRFVQG